MNRFIALTASALALTFAGAASASELTVKIVGKSAPQAYGDIFEAAQTVCRNDLRFDPLGDSMQLECVRAAVRDAVAQAKNPELASYSQTKRVTRIVVVSR